MFFTAPEVKSLSKYSEFGTHLGIKDFALMALVSVMLHIAGMIIYSLSPKEQAMIIPVRVLNIKLNGGDVEMPPASEMPSYQPEAPPPPPPVSVAQATMDKASPLSTPLPEAPKKVEKRRIRKVPEEQDSLKDSTAAKPKQYVREGDITSMNKDKSDGTPGNGTGIAGTKEGQEIVSKYEQEISLWMAQHKHYPEAAKEAKIEGSAVVRIRIDRLGNITYSAIDSSSGNQIIDQAVIDMVNSSNPVPRVPDNYPEGKELEFLIPVSFKLQ